MKHIQVDRVSAVKLIMGLLRLSTMPWAAHPLRKHLITRRRMLGIPLNNLVEVTGWNRMYMAKWESGSRVPTDKQLQDWIVGLDRLCAEVCAPCNRTDTHRNRVAA